VADTIVKVVDTPLGKRQFQDRNDPHKMVLTSRLL
jgi:hypothetical protein